ncbi:phosphate ABC transporter substrate-binding protein [Nostoc paludosum FACHB-159]|uniref:Phosphate ABC transporter substrate-binding protein n=2 Tax=Nostoc TaxID=1177 RepID=A0ABR8KBT9_9NOSO|nr:phosphate ABC transporter substrate-binding protein [Nostoc paludosum]MBD2679196.1 phosphate ABC transporter substrate-binding protein [Nostoc sp. FACHB-857]MBD2735577.1 phosphate ABC transporter substrate-binding protein [Nostoc paludosum FACHB-159]
MDNDRKLKLRAKSVVINSFIILAALGDAYLMWALWPKTCPTDHQKLNNSCVLITSHSNLTISPKPTISPPTSIPLYRTFADVPNIPQGRFRYGGSTSFAPLRSPAITAQIFQAHPRFELSYAAPLLATGIGSGTGIKMLLEGQLSFSQSSRPVKTEEFQEAKTKNFRLEQIPVAIDGIAFYVNPNLSIPGLTVSQIKDIYTGKITNWSQVGGQNLEISPLSRDPKSGGTPEYIQETILGNEAFAETLKPYVQDTTTAIRTVAKTPGGISYATASEVCNQSIKPLSIAREPNQDFVSPCIGKKVNKIDFAKDTYPLVRRLFVVIKRDGSLDEQAGVAYVNLMLSDQGQQLLNQAGLVPIRDL